MHKPILAALTLAFGLGASLPSMAAKTGSIQVHGLSVDFSNSGYVLFSIDASSKDGVMKSATLEYWVDGCPRQNYKVDPTTMQGPYLIEKAIIQQANLAYDRTVHFHWLLENGNGEKLDSGLQSFFNADISPWKDLARKSFDTEHFTHSYKLNETMVRSYADLMEKTYAYLSKEFGFSFPGRIPIVYFDGQLHAFLEDSPLYDAMAYTDFRQGSITVHSNCNNEEKMFRLFVHELTHAFDAMAAKKSQLTELHVRYLELRFTPAYRLEVEREIAFMSDEAIDDLVKPELWGYSPCLAYGFFENLAMNYAGGNWDSLSALVSRQKGRTLDEKCECLTGKSVDKLFAEAVAYLKACRDRLSLDQMGTVSTMKVLQQMEIEDKQWLPGYGSISRDAGRILVDGEFLPGSWADLCVYPVRESTRALDEIMILDVASGKVANLTKDGFSQRSPVWSPDGTEIYFIGRYGPDYGLYRMTSEGTNQEKLLSSAGRLDSLILSGDGRNLVFARDEGLGRTNLFMLEVGSGKVSRLTDGTSRITSALAIGEGKYLFVSESDSKGFLFLLDAATGKPERLKAEADVGRIHCLSPDGLTALVEADGIYALCSLQTGKIDLLRFEDSSFSILAATFTASGDLEALLMSGIVSEEPKFYVETLGLK